ncbi:MAG: iron-containing alcohol dehydrogenase [Dehalococcoidia bacterium]|nr:iron-containing alcohol dehydrogenase [Dehalococcoidia bacterium]
MPVSSTNIWPRRVVFGAGALDNLAKELGRWAGGNALLITDQRMAASDGAARVKAAAKEAGLTLHVFDQVEENPSDKTVHLAAEAILDTGPAVLVGLGGGSPLDCAKAANIIVCNGGRIQDYDLTNPSKAKIGKALPWVSIPTTAGTGSEVCPVTVVTDSRRHVKFSISSPRLIAEVCIADPDLTVTMPPDLTAWTGADALTHAVEAYYSRVAFPVGSALALESIRLIGKYLPMAVRNGTDMEAREQMLMGSLLAGIAFAQNALGLAHAMAHQLTSEFGLQHGLANGIVLPLVMEFNARGAPQKLAAVAQALGAPTSGLGDAEVANKGIEAVQALLASIGIPSRIEGVTLTESVKERLVAQAMGDTLFGLNPVKATASEISELYNRVI